MLAGLALLLPPIPQPPGYHDFADQRACLGLPNCLNTLSNALFLLAGALGLMFLRGMRGQGIFLDRRERGPYRLFFFGAVLIGFGSGYYHLEPDNGRLLWDRLAIMLTFMAWFAAILSERVGARAGLGLLPLLLMAGVGSVAYWYLSETRGAGDLRPYLLMQLYPMLLVPLLLVVYPPRYGGGGYVPAVIGMYLLALVLDLTDRAVFDGTGGLLSGHTLKHLVGALAVLAMVLYLVWRQPYRFTAPGSGGSRQGTGPG